MTDKRPPATRGMRHVALYVKDMPAAERFYVELLGMKEEWRPDPDNLYLTSGNDNLALHTGGMDYAAGQHLDHIGFFMGRPEEVDAWYVFLKDNGVEMKTEPRTHRDGARSFYCLEPSGVRVQIIFHPPIAAADQIQ